jgi:tetratricopeptide (TPR) repeat protein
MHNGLEVHLRKAGAYLLTGAGVTLIGAVIAFFAVLFSTILPIMLSSQSSDFSIIVRPIDVEANRLESDISPSLLQILNPILFENGSRLRSKPAIIQVQNTIYYGISSYGYPVYLKTVSSNPNIYIDFDDNPQGIPNFETKMYVYVKPTNKSIIHYPVIIQGIGGNGKIRNCTFYVTYITPGDYVRMGNNQSLMARYSDAVGSYGKAIEIDPKQLGAWYGKGNALYRLGKYEEALNAYDRAIELDPQYVDAWYSKGAALYSLDKYEEAIQAWNKTIELDPQYVDAWVGKGAAIDDQGKHEDAVMYYNKAIEIDPQYAGAWFNKGYVFSWLALPLAFGDNPVLSVPRLPASS